MKGGDKIVRTKEDTSCSYFLETIIGEAADYRHVIRLALLRRIVLPTTYGIRVRNTC